MKLENWGDLFKYNKELLDDDYNHGQALVLKTKSKAANSTVSTVAKIWVSKVWRRFLMCTYEDFW